MTGRGNNPSGSRFVRPATARHLTRAWLVAAAVALFASAPAAAQISQLVSPGPLSRAHATLEGVDKCQKCHEPGRGVAADLCLSCHKPVADRIRLKKGVHREVKGDCASCHVEHAGADAELRPLDRQTFNHAEETGFVLAGRHAALSRDCAKCHKTRSFLAATPVCSTCHADIHKPSLGSDCRVCHSTEVTFKEARAQFDHSKAAFQLTGAHRSVTCAKCHVNQAFKGVKFAQCTDCHKSPHRQPMGNACTSCHDGNSWKTQKVDHGRTAFPLKGKHAEVACAKCHTRPPLQAALKFNRCATCHQDPHRGAFKQDCSSCHNETGFGRGTFDHATGTRFALTGAHAKLACAKCHKNAAGTGAAATRVVDFRGQSTACASCHADVHKAELGKACETCHTAASFRVTAFTHPRMPEFFGGQHQSVACAGCHVARAPGAPARTGVPVDGWTFKNRPTACVACHQDVHLGQVGPACESCHSVDAAKFAPVRFSHATAAFKLTGKHEVVECRKCHKPETGAFRAGAGTAVRLKGVATACASCHQDQHLGQLGRACESCHTPASFKVASFKHANQATFFLGKHAAQPCSACHKPAESAYPAGRGTAVRYKGLTACASCHKDAHAGSMGSSCEGCHTPEGWVSASRAFHKTSRFQLEGRHLDVPCAKCHLSGAVQGTPNKCYDCHWVRRQDDPYRTRLGSDCETCHRPISWTAVDWNHGAATGHAAQPGAPGARLRQLPHGPALRCRQSVVLLVPREAVPVDDAAGSCGRWVPDAVRGVPQAVAHVVLAGRFEHSAYFPLVGVHATQACASCHRNGVYKGTPRDCVGCHRTNYQRTTSPNHAAAGFPTTCESCHRQSDTTWKDDVQPRSVFPLVGRACDAGLHGLPQEQRLQGHAARLRRLPPHELPADRPARITRRPASRPRASPCHKASDSELAGHVQPQRDLPPRRRACDAGLHGVPQEQRRTRARRATASAATARTTERTTSPNHVAAGFPTACESCHKASDSSWQGARSTTTRPSRSSACTRRRPVRACHKNDVYKGTPRDCVGCHLHELPAHHEPEPRGAGSRPRASPATRPPTRAGGPRSTTTRSSPSSALHATQACTRVPQEQRVQGHAPRLRRLPPHELRAHHEPESRVGRVPDRVRVLPQGLRFELAGHASITTPSFALVGVHATQACTRVPQEQRVQGHAPRLRTAATSTNYERTTSPNHVSAGFPTACESCHSASSSTWTASFDHNRFFVLAGRHLSAACSSCHRNNVYRGTPRECYPCHQAQYRPDDESEPQGGRVPDDMRGLSPEHRHVVLAGPVHPHVVPDHVRGARRPGVRGVPPGSEQLQGLLLHDLPYAGEDGLGSQRPRRVPIRLGRVLLVPPDGTELGAGSVR